MLTFLIAALVLLVDQLTKFLIRRSFNETDTLVVLQDFFNVTYIRNRGGVFGILQHQQMLFSILSVLTIIVILYFYRYYMQKRRICNVAVGLILGGALGNLSDRLLLDREGCVTDWLDFYWGSYHWPAFNIADSAICVGVFILLYLMILKSELYSVNQNQ